MDDVALGLTDQITVRCTYDNTPENRARVGLSPESVLVTAGEGTGDEMCIGSLQLVARDPTP